MNFQGCRKWVRQQAKIAAKDWQIEQSKNIYAEFYLYFKRGQVMIARELPGEDWYLASPQRITGTKEQVEQFSIDTLWKCPCLPD